MPFGLNFGRKAKDAVNQFSGNKDFLEGFCAVCALTAAAEGGIDDAEYDKTLTVIRSNTPLADNATGPCSECGVMLQFRPFMSHVKRLCMQCAAKAMKEAEDDGQIVEVGMTARMMQEVLTIFGADEKKPQ